ncbi:MAG: type II toxin-antitoxin system HicA family toxin [Caulobacteraceae bacterium]
MAGIDKLTERFKAVPSDFTWDELTRLLARFGYAEQKRKGSRRKFKGDRLPTLILHEPHPGRILRQYALRYVKETLENEGLL